MTTPIVAVFMVTYNHENYIGKAIDSVLMQKTSFPFKLFIGEDCSTDQTASICLKYQKKHSGKIDILRNDYNIGGTNNAKHIFRVCSTSGAKYIAMLEGDDYWTDPYKLQKQVDFLDQNDDFIVSCHDASVIDLNGDVILKSKLPPACKRDFTGMELINGAFILTLSICYRNVINEMPPEFNKAFNGDTFLTSMLGVYGKSKYQDEIDPAVYLSHPAGIWSSKSDSEKKKDQQKTYYYLFKYHKRVKTDKTVVKTLFDKYYNIKFDTYSYLIKVNKYGSAFRVFSSLLFTCIKYGYLLDVYKSLRKGIKVFYKVLAGAL